MMLSDDEGSDGESTIVCLFYYNNMQRKEACRENNVDNDKMVTTLD